MAIRNSLSPGLAVLLPSFVRYGPHCFLTLSLIYYLGGGARFVFIWFFVFTGVSSAYRLSEYCRYTIQRRRLLVSLGDAQDVPTYKGRWPGSLDLLLRIYTDLTRGYPHEMVGNIMEMFSPTFRTSMLGSDIVWTSDVDFIHHMLSKSPEKFMRGEKFRFAASSLVGDGIFVSDGDVWRAHRALARSSFNKRWVSDLGTYKQPVDSVISVMKKHAVNNAAFDIQELMGLLTLNTGMTFVLGRNSRERSNNCMATKPCMSDHCISCSWIASSSAKSLSHALSQGLEKFWWRLVLDDWWCLAELAGDKIHKHAKVLDQELLPVIQAAIFRSTSYQRGVSGEHDISADDDGSLLSNLVRVTQDVQYIKDEVINVLLAARDTTTSTLTSLFYGLSQEAEVTRRLQEEILERLGDREPELEDFKHLPYLRAVIDETLRFYTPVPANLREVTTATTWKSPREDEKPYYFEQGTKICYMVMFMHRNKSLWGPSASEFDPDRWLDERRELYYERNRKIFMPFGEGLHLCIGRQMAYNQISYIVCKFFQNFSGVELAPDAQPSWSRPPASWKAPVQKGGLTDVGQRKARETVWSKIDVSTHTYGGLWVRTRGQDSIRASNRTLGI